MKAILWEQSDGSVWAVPAAVVAKARAEYYAKNDPETTYQDEFDYTMGDDYELTDWVGNNMNAEDVIEHAKMITPPRSATFEEAFKNGDVSVAEIPNDVTLERVTIDELLNS